MSTCTSETRLFPNEEPALLVGGVTSEVLRTGSTHRPRLNTSALASGDSLLPTQLLLRTVRDIAATSQRVPEPLQTPAQVAAEVIVLEDEVYIHIDRYINITN